MLEDMYRKSVPLAKPAEVGSLASWVVLDTRALEEFEVSHLPGARFMDYQSFKAEALEDLPRDTPILVYCSVGYRSERIGEKLQDAGFTHVRNLYGGIFYWHQEGKPIVNIAEEPTHRIHTYNKKWSAWCLTGEKVY